MTLLAVVLMRARHVGVFAKLEGRRRHVLSDQAFIDAIGGAAAGRFGFARAPIYFDRLLRHDHRSPSPSLPIGFVLRLDEKTNHGS